MKTWNLLMPVSQNNSVYIKYLTAFKLYWASKKECKLFRRFLYPSIPIPCCLPFGCMQISVMLLFPPLSSISLQAALTIIWRFRRRSDSYCTWLTGPSAGAGARARLCLLPGSWSQLHLFCGMSLLFSKFNPMKQSPFFLLEFTLCFLD